MVRNIMLRAKNSELYNRLCNIDGDKYVHLLACQVIAYYASLLCSVVLGRWVGAGLGFVISVTVGFFKELSDDKFDYDDFKFDIIGSAWGIMYFLL